MAFNLDHLRTFYLVARYMSFSKAAGHLHLSQPAVSRQIQALERELGLDLFSVRGRRVELSEAGRVLYDQAEQILHLVRNAEQSMEELQDLETGEVRICASNTPGNYILPAVIARFQSRYPGLRVDLRVGNSEAVWQQITVGECELGFVGASPKEIGGIVAENVYEDELLLVAAPQHPLASRRQVSPDDLLQHTLLVREEGSGTREVLEEHLRSLNLSGVNVVTLGHPEAIKRAVQAGMGVAFLPGVTLHCEIGDGRLQPLSASWANPRRPILMISQRGRRLSPAGLAFRAYVHRAQVLV